MNAVQDSAGAARLDIPDKVFHLVALALFYQDDISIPEGKKLPESIQIILSCGREVRVLSLRPVRLRPVVDVGEIVTVPPELVG
jgi:hypothetical protein